jgi:hypothetical protein
MALAERKILLLNDNAVGYIINKDTSKILPNVNLG